MLTKVSEDDTESNTNKGTLGDENEQQSQTLYCITWMDEKISAFEESVLERADFFGV